MISKSRFILMGLACLVFFGSIPFTAVASSPVKVSLNGKLIAFPNQSIIKNGWMLVPIRSIAESVNAKLLWDKDGGFITIVKNGIMSRFKIGSRFATINDQSIV